MMGAYGKVRRNDLSVEVVLCFNASCVIQICHFEVHESCE